MGKIKTDKDRRAEQVDKEMRQQEDRNERLYTRKERIRRVRRVALPDNTIFVGRPSKWAGPWGYSKYGHELAKEYHWEWMLDRHHNDKVHYNVEQLRGYNLACWCKPEEEHCIADNFLDLLYGKEDDPLEEMFVPKGTGRWILNSRFKSCTGARQCKRCKDGEKPHGPYYRLWRRNIEGIQETIHLGADPEWILNEEELVIINARFGYDTPKTTKKEIAFALWGVLV